MRSKLRELRAAREWSQSDLADKLGVSRQTINAIETGRFDPSLPLAFRIAAAIPEPTALGLTATGVLATLVCARRQRRRHGSHR